MLNSSSEAVVVTEQGLGDQANNRRVPESERWDADSIFQVRGTLWSTDGSDDTFDIQVGMERPTEMVPRDPGEVLMENKVARTYHRRADFEKWGLREGCRYLLKGDSEGAARLAAADERINRALADAVERHAAEDLRVRGTLKRTSTTRHPQSESQKKVCTGHRARLDATPFGLTRRIISIRHATQHRHKDCPGCRHE